jgi:hypothetical protein
MTAKPTSPWRLPLLVIGGLLVVLSPVVGMLPGPGGIFLFAGGLVLMLRNSRAVKRVYAKFKRAYPRLGNHADRALRRSSWRRRQALAKAADAAAD